MQEEIDWWDMLEESIDGRNECDRQLETTPVRWYTWNKRRMLTEASRMYSKTIVLCQEELGLPH